jgi:hypothetical protein
MGSSDIGHPIDPGKPTTGPLSAGPLLSGP